jgi:hypothetical protein
MGRWWPWTPVPKPTNLIDVMDFLGISRDPTGALDNGLAAIALSEPVRVDVV